MIRPRCLCSLARAFTAHTQFVEIDHEIISTVILLQEGLYSVTSGSMCTKYWLPRNKVRLGELTLST